MISVVIPAYNAQSTLGAQLDALLAQRTSHDYEVIVVDDHSTDATAEIIDRYCNAHPMTIRSATTDSTEHGPSSARNTGARLARGEYLLFCDADDIASPDWVDQMMTDLGSSSLVVGVLDTFVKQPSDNDDQWANYQVWNQLCDVGASANLGITRSLFHALGGFDSRLIAAEDIDLCVRAYLAGHPTSASSARMHYRLRTGYRAQYRQARGYAYWDTVLRYHYREYIRDAGGPSITATVLVKDLAATLIRPSRWPRTREQASIWSQQLGVKAARIKAGFHHLSRTPAIPVGRRAL